MLTSPLHKYGSVYAASRVFEGHKLQVSKSKLDGKIRLAGDELHNPCGVLDISWLPSAAEAYHLSSDPSDFVIVELPIVTADIPNRNLDSFPFEELSSFNPMIGRITYQTLIGKPTHQDHDNKDPTKAKGAIFDASFKLANNVWHVKELAGFDRTKDPDLTNEILRSFRSGKPVAFSMGALAGYVECSICKHTSDGRQENMCEHVHPRKGGKGRIVEGKLVYENCRGVNFIETSKVDDPADITAVSNDILYEGD